MGKQFLMKGDLDWAYWPINGTQSTGSGKTLGAPESYSVLDPTWTKPALPRNGRPAEGARSSEVASVVFRVKHVSYGWLLLSSRRLPRP
jgi:hypothetical protein